MVFWGWMMELSEAKEISLRLQQIILKLDGVKNPDGSILKQGMLTELEALVGKIDPNAIGFINNQQKRIVEESLKRIDALLVNQRSHFEDMLEALTKEHEDNRKKTKDEYQKMQKEFFTSIEKNVPSYLTQALTKPLEDFEEKIRVSNIEIEKGLIKASGLYDRYYLNITIALAVGATLGYLISLTS